MIYTIERSQTLSLESAMIRFDVSKFLNPNRCKSARLKACILEIRESSFNDIPFYNRSFEWGLLKGVLLKMYEMVYPFSTNLNVDISRHYFPESAGHYLELGYNFINKAEVFDNKVRCTPGAATLWLPIKEELNVELINEV